MKRISSLFPAKMLLHVSLFVFTLYSMDKAYIPYENSVDHQHVQSNLDLHWSLPEQKKQTKDWINPDQTSQMWKLIWIYFGRINFIGY